MWDNRATKRNPKAPDFKCRDRTCDGVLWPGQHRAAVPIFTPARRPNEADEPPRELSAADSSNHDGLTVSATRRQCYLDVTDFVLTQVRPKYEAAGVPCTADTVAAIAATLFIATCKAGSV